MSTLTNFLKLVKPNRLEGYNIAVINDNMDIIDKSIPSLTVAGKPADKQTKIFYGKVSVNTGAGGDDPTKVKATDLSGYGGLWPGNNGIPVFEGISYVRLDDSGNTENFGADFIVTDVTLTRIKFRGKKFAPANEFATDYSVLNMYVTIVGW